MNNHYHITITLKVLGPFLTSAVNPQEYGVDRWFFRNEQGALTIPASHFKGKLRMALEELAELGDFVRGEDIDRWFGRPSGDERGHYEPRPGKLRFGHLVGETPQETAYRTRVSIHPVTQTAAENLLRTVEDPIPSGEVATFSGLVQFVTADAEEAKRIARALRLALVWLPHLGAEKGVGFGRLQWAQVSEPQAAPPQQKPLAFLSGDALHFHLKPLEPILVGGVKSRRSNFVVSRRELSGGVIKGALAEALNEAFGIEPLARKIEPTEAHRYPGYEHLVAHFSAIRISHAFPALAGSPRPVRKPISLASYGPDAVYDTALATDEDLLRQGKAPAFFVDWKGWEPYAGGAEPRMVYVTRTAIDDVTRRAAESQLFTYAFMAPVDERDQELAWIGNVSFAGIEDEAARQAAKKEFIDALRTLPLRLGKLGRPVDIMLNNGFATPALERKPGLVDGLAIVTLQTDAIMLEAEAVARLQPHEDLHALYAAFWQEISDGALILEDFFAHQGFEGGYLYHRKLGAAERQQAPNRYRPYYLTRAGSVFRLKAQDEARAEALLARWQQQGLPWPQWAKTAYGAYDRAYWENCPFVPENGYGEIIVNLAWHWEKRIDSTPAPSE